ncbi:MAG: 23S rRNA (uracil(1939)-C(5))-methyltransferase RlmD [Leptospiraceae bacterium]|nr:23S rRNA (uracil(1939)-C(5))-methyltransferase RlmD [Leptospiraceae bacterium]
MKKLNCTHFPSCSGCDLLDLEYEEELKEKWGYMINLFSKFQDVEVLPVLGSNPHSNYRHKLQLTFAPEQRKGSGIVLGLHTKRRDKILNQIECKIQDEALSETAWALRDWANDLGLTGYNHFKQRGFLRFLSLRKSYYYNTILIGLVTRDNSRIYENEIEDLLKKIYSSFKTKSLKEKISGIIQAVNSEPTNMVLNTQERYLLYGQEKMKDRISDIEFEVGLDTFVQVNPFQTEKLYEVASNYFNSSDSVLELYSGIGALSLLISRKARFVTGIEINPNSVQSAKRCAERNNRTNVKFLQGDAGNLIKLDSLSNHNSCLVDPPRSGLSYKITRVLSERKFNKLVYISCNPETLERDAVNLRREYKLVSITPVDLFPHTEHIENIAYFESR